MTDLGTLPDLSHVFSDLGGRIPGDRVLASTSRHLHWDTAFFQELGGRLGSFFATLHSPEILKEVRSLLESDAELINTSAREVVLDGAIKPVGDLLRRFPDLISVEEVDELLAALTEDFWRSNEANEESLILGDCWTGAVLAAPTPTADLELTMKVGVIDWEFASIGRGAHGDMAQFLAHLELLSISASQSPDFDSHQAALHSLIESIIRSYRETSTHPVTRADDARNPTAQALCAKAIRSALLSHGAEIINNTFWKRWRCVETACSRATGGNDLHADESQVHECILIRRMVARGLDYLRAGYRYQLPPSSRSPSVDDNDARRFWLLDLFQSTDPMMLAKVVTPSL